MIPFPLQRGGVGRRIVQPAHLDPDFSSVVLLVGCVGVQNATAFVDASSAGRSITANGNAKIDRGRYKFGGSSAVFDGVDDYLSISNSADFNFGTGSFTVECWFLKDTVSNGTLCLLSNYQNSGNGFCMQIDNNQLIFNASGDGADIRGATSIAAGQWYHAAVSGAAGSIKLFLDGVQQGSTFAGATAMNSTAILSVGALYAGSPVNDFQGWIGPIRVTKGVARYGSNFTPPALPFPTSA